MWGESNEAVFPVMRTDINIETKDSILVIDAKCTPKVAAERQDYGKLTLSSGHLYQLFTYMHHCGEANPEKKVRGALVYPLYKIDVDSIVETSAGSLRVKTVDFKQEWEKVRQDLLELAFG